MNTTTHKKPAAISSTMAKFTNRSLGFMLVALVELLLWGIYAYSAYLVIIILSMLSLITIDNSTASLYALPIGVAMIIVQRVFSRR